MSNLGESKKKMATRENATLKELAYVRRRPVVGRSTRSTNSRAMTSRSHERRPSNHQVILITFKCSSYILLFRLERMTSM